MQFEIALSNVLLTLFYIVPGYVICKMKKASTDHLSTISSLLIYGCAPCLIISSFLKLDFSLTDVGNMGLFFLITLILQAAFMGMVYLIFRRRFSDSKYRILTIASVLGNVGFFGLPIVRALVPDHPEVMCYSIIYVISMNILVFTIGAFCITGRKEFMTLRAAIFNPSMFGLVIAFPLYLIGARSFLPDFLINGMDLLGTMSTPLCMLILGVRLATVPLKKLFCRPFIYLVCLGKLILFPLFCYGAVYLLPLDPAFKSSILILCATPCASIILNLAEMHNREAELAANCVLVTTLLCFLTIPVLTLLL